MTPSFLEPNIHTLPPQKTTHSCEMSNGNEKQQYPYQQVDISTSDSIIDIKKYQRQSTLKEQWKHHQNEHGDLDTTPITEKNNQNVLSRQSSFQSEAPSALENRNPILSKFHCKTHSTSPRKILKGDSKVDIPSKQKKQVRFRSEVEYISALTLPSSTTYVSGNTPGAFDRRALRK